MPRELAEEWDERFPEGIGISSIAKEEGDNYVRCRKELANLGLTDLIFLTKLQELHDRFWNGWSRNEFIAQALHFAAKHNLSAAVLPEPVA
jgi:hypothetical protein